MRTRRALASAVVVLLASMGLGVSSAPADAATVGVTVAGGNGYGPAANQLANPEGVAVDGSGNVYVGDGGNQRVQRWAPGATAGATVAGGNGLGSAANQFSYPRGVALDGSGNLYVADTGFSEPAGDRVQRWAPGATAGVTVAGGNGAGSAANQLRNPGDVALDSSGNLYVADSGNQRVMRWAPGATEGVLVAGATANPSGGVNPIWGVAVDASRNVYVSEWFGDRVKRWAPGATEGVTVAGGNGEGAAANQLHQPAGVEVDRAGNVYVADLLNDRVQLWAPGATEGLTVAGGHGNGSAANQLDGPWAVAVDGSGNLYVADRNNYRVQRWAAEPPKVQPGAATVLEGDSGTATVEVPLTLSKASADTVTVQWNTGFVPGAPAGQADPATDYTPASGTVTFAPGETVKTVPIIVHGDTLVEPSEYIVVSFHDSTNATMGGFWGLGFGVITADDNVLTPDVESVAEGNSGTATIQVPITLSNSSTQPVIVQWNTLFAAGAPGDQADPATDYTPASGTVTFAPGETTKAVPVVVHGDTMVEPDEYVVVSFHDPTNGAMGGYWGLGFGIITNDD